MTYAKSALCVALWMVLAAGTEAQNPDLSGSWVLNEELSEDPREEMQKRMQMRRRTGDRSPAGGGGLAGPRGRAAPGAGGAGRAVGGVRAGAVQPPRTRPTATPRSGGPSGSGRGADTFRTMLIDHQDPAISLTDATGQTRRFRTDWAKWQETVRGDIKTGWKRKRLVVEQRDPEGRKTTSKYALDSDGRLVVTITISMGQAGPLSFDRVYDRQPPKQ